jgi:hypothetical protein
MSEPIFAIIHSFLFKFYRHRKTLRCRVDRLATCRTWIEVAHLLFKSGRLLNSPIAFPLSEPSRKRRKAVAAMRNRCQLPLLQASARIHFQCRSRLRQIARRV